MQRLTLPAAVLLVVLCPGVVSANTISIVLNNRTADTIYVVSAFASQLVPNFRNLTSVPLLAGSKRTVIIFDDYNKCVFDFSIDFNPLPRPGRKRTRKAKPFRVMANINICQQKLLDVK